MYPRVVGRLANTSRLLRKGIAALTPPLARYIAHYVAAEWVYEPRGWNATGPTEGGWSHPSVADAQQRHWPTLVKNVAGTGPLGVSHLVSRPTRENLADHNATMSYGYVLGLASRTKQTLRMLDWGGGLGHYRLYTQALLPELSVDYHCFDTPLLCKLGRGLQPDVHFHENPDDLTRMRFDLVITSSSLHYFEQWRKVLSTLIQCTDGYLYVARLMTVDCTPSFVIRQRPRSHGYLFDVPSWFINRNELIEHMEKLGMKLVREFLYAEHWRPRNAPEKGICRGFLFRSC